MDKFILKISRVFICSSEANVEHNQQRLADMFAIISNDKILVGFKIWVLVKVKFMNTCKS